MTKRERRDSRRKLIKAIQQLSRKEFKKMQNDTRQVSTKDGKASLGKKLWLITNIQDKTNLYAMGILIPPQTKKEVVPEVQVES